MAAIRIDGKHYPTHGWFIEARGVRCWYPKAGESGHGHQEPAEISNQPKGNRNILGTRWRLVDNGQRWQAVLEGEVRIDAPSMMAAYFYLVNENRELLREGMEGGRDPAESSVVATEEEIEELGRGSPSGQGPRIGAEARRAIEQRGMQVAREGLAEAGWTSIQNVSQESVSCDLLCQQDGDQLWVEVKGTTGPWRQVIVTHREVAVAREAPQEHALAIVWDIDLSSDENDKPVATGGIFRLLHPWEIDQSRLRPIAYMYQVPPP